MEFLIFLICLIILIFFIYWGIYNYLVEVKNNVSTAYANIDVQLKNISMAIVAAKICKLKEKRIFKSLKYIKDIQKSD